MMPTCGLLLRLAVCGHSPRGLLSTLGGLGCAARGSAGHMRACPRAACMYRRILQLWRVVPTVHYFVSRTSNLELNPFCCSGSTGPHYRSINLRLLMVYHPLSVACIMTTGFDSSWGHTRTGHVFVSFCLQATIQYLNHMRCLDVRHICRNKI
jgi:hypothetical protein